LVEAGFLCVEIPLNSPDPLESVARLRRAVDGRALVGAGTVLNPEEARATVRVGGQIVISPNTDPAVIAAAKESGAVSLPGFYTASEAFTAIKAGADALKLFPADTAGPKTLKALRAVVSTIPIFPVGGVSADADQMREWIAAGASGFGLASALYTPGRGPHEVKARAVAFVAAYREAKG
jgi:2-dehydro-3-deoxyphosphogalactonate aldolase